MRQDTTTTDTCKSGQAERCSQIQHGEDGTKHPSPLKLRAMYVNKPQTLLRACTTLLSSYSFIFWTNNGAWPQQDLPNISFNITQPPHLSPAEPGNALSFALLQGQKSKHSQQPGTYWAQRCSPRVWQVETARWSLALTGWTSALPRACLTSAGPCEGSSCPAGREHLQWIKGKEKSSVISASMITLLPPPHRSGDIPRHSLCVQNSKQPTSVTMSQMTHAEVALVSPSEYLQADYYVTSG